MIVPYVMPEEWFNRMDTIETYEEDYSASERIRAWVNAVKLANEHFMGGGYRALVYYGGRDAHSIYFGVLGEQGWVGLGMFLLLIALAWQKASWIIRHSRGHPDLLWARDLAAMIQVSLIGYMSAGAFLGLQYFDLFYHLTVIIVMTQLLVKEQVEPKLALRFTGKAAPGNELSPVADTPPTPALPHKGGGSLPSR
jgi:probable O-glycosylation ligase (exosortase A-associated)